MSKGEVVHTVVNVVALPLFFLLAYLFVSFIDLIIPNSSDFNYDFVEYGLLLLFLWALSLIGWYIYMLVVIIRNRSRALFRNVQLCVLTYPVLFFAVLKVLLEKK